MIQDIAKTNSGLLKYGGYSIGKRRVGTELLFTIIPLSFIIIQK